MESAVHARRRSILAQHKRVVVVAGSVAATTLRQCSSPVLSRRRLAHRSTDAGVVRLAIVFAADVGGGVVDGAGEDVGGVELRDRGGDGVGQCVAVGAGNDDLELVAVLAHVGGGGFGGGDTPEGTLDCRSSSGIRAGIRRVEGRIALVEDVEGEAGGHTVAVCGAGLDVVRGEGVVAEITRAGHGAIIVGEGARVAGGREGEHGDAGKEKRVLEARDGVWEGGGSVKVGLGSAGGGDVDRSGAGLGALGVQIGRVHIGDSGQLSRGAVVDGGLITCCEDGRTGDCRDGSCSDFGKVEELGLWECES